MTTELLSFLVPVCIVAFAVAGLLYGRLRYRMGFHEAATRNAREYEKTMQEIGVGEEDLGVLSGDWQKVGQDMWRALDDIPKPYNGERLWTRIKFAMPWKRWSIVRSSFVRELNRTARERNDLRAERESWWREVNKARGRARDLAAHLAAIQADAGTVPASGNGYVAHGDSDG